MLLICFWHHSCGGACPHVLVRCLARVCRISLCSPTHLPFPFTAPSHGYEVTCGRRWQQPGCRLHFATRTRRRGRKKRICGRTNQASQAFGHADSVVTDRNPAALTHVPELIFGSSDGSEPFTFVAPVCRERHGQGLDTLIYYVILRMGPGQHTYTLVNSLRSHEIRHHEAAPFTDFNTRACAQRLFFFTQKIYPFTEPPASCFV